MNLLIRVISHPRHSTATSSEYEIRGLQGAGGDGYRRREGDGEGAMEEETGR